MAEAQSVREEGSREGEAALVSRLGAGSPEACRELCDQYGPRLHRYAAARLLGDGRLAEEVTVEALADGVRNIGRFDPRRSALHTWLYGIVQRKIRGARRSQRRLKSVPAWAEVPLESAAQAQGKGDVLGETVSRLEARRQVGELIETLSETEFEVLALHCVDELSAREIGQIVGRSERAIHSLLHRARRKARERLVRDER